MHVIAATFRRKGRAARALHRIRSDFALGDSQVGLARLAAREGPEDEHVLLAGRFVEEEVVAARETLESLGGTVVADIVEASSAEGPARRPN